MHQQVDVAEKWNFVGWAWMVVAVVAVVVDSDEGMYFGLGMGTFGWAVSSILNALRRFD